MNYNITFVDYFPVRPEAEPIIIKLSNDKQNDLDDDLFSLLYFMFTRRSPLLQCRPLNRNKLNKTAHSFELMYGRYSSYDNFCIQFLIILAHTVYDV